MRKKLWKIMAVVVFVLLVIGSNFNVKAYAEELYKEDTATIRLDYTDFQYAEVKMPSDGYIIISHEETMIAVGIDSDDESKAQKIYGDGKYKARLTKGSHKIYLFDGAGTHFFEKEYATVHYKIYVNKDDDTETAPIQDGYKYYVIDGQSCGIKSYVGESSEIMIPDEIDGYRVTVIGQKSFANKDFIKKIVIPKSVQEIEDKAFSDCYSLSAITFGADSQLQKMGEEVFSDCESLQKIVIPKNVKKIEEDTFFGCKKLSSVTFESGSKLQKIEEEAFSECTNLKKMVIPRNVKTIDEGAFYDCKNMTEITFESGSKLQKIEEEAFSDCVRLKKITLTSKVITSIGEDAFYRIDKKAVIKVPGSKVAKYKKLLGEKTGIKATMKIVSNG